MRAAAVAEDVADRLRSPECVAQFAAGADRHNTHPRWDASSLLLGHPGIAMLYAALSADDGAWAASTHAHLGWASRSTVTPDALIELIPAALVHRAAHGGYARLLRSAGGALAETCTLRVSRYRGRGPGVAMAEYDVVSGLAGKARLLLALAELGDERCAEALTVTLRYLVSLTQPVAVHGVTVPGWWTSPDRYTLTADRERYPHGDLNAGLAHGITGPLAVLALAYSAGHRVEGMVEAMGRIVSWLLGWQLPDGFGPRWPARVGLDESDPTPAKAAWCYGTAGVARTLQLAAVALDDPALSALAMKALRGVFARPWEQANLAGPTLCHGEAGLLQVVLRAAEIAPEPELAAAADKLAQRIVDAFNPSAPFGFRHRHHTGPDSPWFNEPGLLIGAAGVALALATYAGTCTARWDSALLLT